ncbi:MAG TPA: STAS domain-containing protein [Sedimentisphaerales bacterium]|nr:STAS domain-containing protein [Sedimentisphaerales bacterium]
MCPFKSSISVRQDNDVTVVTLNDGQILREDHIKQIEDSIMPLTEEGRCPNLMLDFCNVEYMSSAFLGLLVKMHKRMCHREGRLTLRNVNRRIYQAFKITRLNKVFDISRKRK